MRPEPPGSLKCPIQDSLPADKGATLALSGAEPQKAERVGPCGAHLLWQLKCFGIKTLKIAALAWSLWECPGQGGAAS